MVTRPIGMTGRSTEPKHEAPSAPAVTPPTVPIGVPLHIWFVGLAMQALVTRGISDDDFMAERACSIARAQMREIGKG